LHGGDGEFNFALSNGEKTNTGAAETQVVSLNLPGSVVKRVSVWCGDIYTIGIQMFDQKGASILDIGKKNYSKYDFDLNDGERIVGI
jgi:hypothetical protein